MTPSRDAETLLLRTDRALFVYLAANVYGRFHYALDVVAGWTLALVVVAACRFLDSKWGSAVSAGATEAG